METSWTLPVPKHKFSDLYLCFCGYEASRSTATALLYAPIT